MKPRALLPAVLATLPLAFALSARAADDPTADEEAVRAACEDYVLAFYLTEPERIERSVSQEMKKMGYWRGPEETEYRGPIHMDREQALDLAARWNAEGQRGEDLDHSVELYEVADKTACAKLTAEWGIDYFQLAKEEDGRWRIHHVMWQSHPR